MATSLIPLKVQKRLVTYYVDTDTVYTAKIKKGADTLTNLTFTPELDDWTFVGWREDTTASNDVLESEIVGKTAITLYAVFSQEITVSYDGNSSTSGSTSSQTGERYYNNGNVTDAEVTLASNGFTRTGYTFSKWAQDSASGTQYAAGASVTLSADATFYAIWTSNAYSVTFAKSQWSQYSAATDGSSSSSYSWAVETNNNTVVMEASKASSATATYVTLSIHGYFDAKGCNRCQIIVYALSEIGTLVVAGTTKTLTNESGTYTFTISGSSSTEIRLGIADTTCNDSNARFVISGIRFYNA